MRCGDNGFRRKDGELCGFSVPLGKNCCHHHDVDKSREQAILQQAKLGIERAKLPEGTLIEEWESVDDVRLTLSRIAKAALCQKGVNLKTLDVAIKAANAATTTFQVTAMRELGDLILRSEGHGKALFLLENLKAGKLTRLPGVAERQTSERTHHHEEERDDLQPTGV
jgi:hypothetical protein